MKNNIVYLVYIYELDNHNFLKVIRNKITVLSDFI